MLIIRGMGCSYFHVLNLRIKYNWFFTCNTSNITFMKIPCILFCFSVTRHHWWFNANELQHACNDILTILFAFKDLCIGFWRERKGSKKHFQWRKLKTNSSFFVPKRNKKIMVVVIFLTFHLFYFLTTTKTLAISMIFSAYQGNESSHVYLYRLYEQTFQ